MLSMFVDGIFDVHSHRQTAGKYLVGVDLVWVVRRDVVDWTT